MRVEAVISKLFPNDITKIDGGGVNGKVFWRTR